MSKWMKLLYSVTLAGPVLHQASRHTIFIVQHLYRIWADAAKEIKKTWKEAMKK